MTCPLEDELRALLSPQAFPAARSPSPALTRDDSLVLFGAGTLGRSTLAKLRSAGVNPVAFADETPSKQNTEIDGLPVIPFEQLTSLDGGKAVVAVTILHPKLGFREARKRLQTISGIRVISFLELARNYPHALLPHYSYDVPERFLSHSSEIQAALALWHDEESRRQFVAHIRFRLHADYEALPLRSQAAYFPKEIWPLLSPETTFVDCGAFDGDTVQAFLSHQNNIFRRIIAFEPDPQNYRRLQDYVSSLPSDISARIQTHNKAVGDVRMTGRLDSTAGLGSSVTETGDVPVEILPARDCVSQHDHPMYVKLDVEGMEREALRGFSGFVSEKSPLMAVSAYHRPADLWELPLCLRHLLGADYQLLLRTEGEDGMEAICYALPAL